MGCQACSLFGLEGAGQDGRGPALSPPHAARQALRARRCTLTYLCEVDGRRPSRVQQLEAPPNQHLGVYGGGRRRPCGRTEAGNGGMGVRGTGEW